MAAMLRRGRRRQPSAFAERTVACALFVLQLIGAYAECTRSMVRHAPAMADGGAEDDDADVEWARARVDAVFRHWMCSQPVEVMPLPHGLPCCVGSHSVPPCSDGPLHGDAPRALGGA